MLTTINYFFICIIEAIILWFYCKKIFFIKHSFRFQLTSYIISYGMLFFILLLQNYIANFISFILINFFLILLIYDVKWYTSIFHAAIMTSIMGLSELLVISLTSHLEFSHYSGTDNFKNLFLLTIFSKILYFVISSIISKIILIFNLKVKPTKKDVLLIAIIPALSAFIMALLVILCNDVNLTVQSNITIIITVVLLFMIDFLTVGIHNYIEKKNQEFTAGQLQAQNDSFSIDYYKMLLTQSENQNILVHDIKNHLSSILALSQQKDTDKINAYINRLLNDNELKSTPRVCDHELLNAILCRYQNECLTNHINFHLDIRSKAMATMRDDDLTALFCNLLDNALEAAIIVPDSYIELDASKKENTVFTQITMINSCRSNPFSPDSKQLRTTKKDSLRHGYGMKSIEKIVERYYGSMETYYNGEDQTFHTIIIMKLIS